MDMNDVKRYEFYGWTAKGNPSTKYWQIKRVAQGFIAEWGKVGRKQGEILYSVNEAYEKMGEKVNKGYKLVR